MPSPSSDSVVFIMRQSKEVFSAEATPFFWRDEKGDRTELPESSVCKGGWFVPYDFPQTRTNDDIPSRE